MTSTLLRLHGSAKWIREAYGAIIVYVTKGSEATRLLQDQYFRAWESTYTKVFESRLHSYFTNRVVLCIGRTPVLPPDIHCDGGLLGHI
jgi:hypothetical protein